MHLFPEEFIQETFHWACISGPGLKSSFLNSLPNDKILDLTKFKAFADDNSNVSKIINSHLDRTENTVGRGQKCWIPALSLFPTMF